MLSRSRIHLAAAALFTALLGAAQWREFAPLEKAECVLQDAVARVGSKAPRDPSLVFLARDTASANLETGADLEQFDLAAADPAARRALQLMAHEWPWPREVYAHVLDRLIAAGARTVVFDFTFPKASPNAASDTAFRAALDRYRDRVVVAGNVGPGTTVEVDHDENAAFSAPAPNLIPATTPRDLRIGFDNFWPDLDDAVRHARYRWAMQRGVWRGDEEFSLAARALQQAGRAALIPAGERDRRLRFAGPAGTFAPRSIYEIFVPAYWQGNFAGGAFFRDKIVLIGAAGNWQQDEHLSALGLMPGPELHLNAINAALHGAFIRELPPVGAAILLGGAALATVLLRRLAQRPHRRLALLAGGSCAWLALMFAVYEWAGTQLPGVVPLLAFIGLGSAGIAIDLARQWLEKSQLRRTLERYVSRNVVDELVAQPDHLSRTLGGDLRDVTVLFSDVRGFTLKAREMSAPELVAQLNEYFSAMVECVFRFGGTLDKFIGDAVMAVWGNTRSAGPAADARNAVACARAMFEELAVLNARWATQGRPQFRIGIGVNSGPVIVGNIGSPQRMEFTVIGDAVNVAWRLQERTKGEHHLLLGEAVLPLLGDEFPTEIIGEIQPTDDAPIAYARLLPLETTAAGCRDIARWPSP